MLNFVWLGLIALAVILGAATGTLKEVGDQSVEGANKAIYLAGTLLAVMTLWLGLMRLADKAGLVHRLGLALKPVMVWLFPDVPPDHPAMGSIIMNMAANILGLNNAATPLGLRAMNELDSLNTRPGVATNAMCMLLAINTSSITLIPVSVLAILAAAHGTDPTVIIGTSLAATAIAHACAIAAVKILERTPFYRLPPLSKDKHAPKASAARTETGDGAHMASDAVKTDATLPWVPGSRWILAAMAGAFLGTWLDLAWPELTHAVTAFFHLPATAAPPPVPDESVSKFFLVRPLRAASVLVLPWLILFFPAYAALRRIPVYEEFVEGGKEAVQVILRILPFIVGMLVAIYMFQAAGGALLLQWVLGPFTNAIGFPAALVPLAALRPFSGIGGLAILQGIVSQYGPNSHLSLAAATMYGCSETTFYVIAVYFGSVGIRKTRHAIPAGLVADIVGPLASVAICRAVFGPF
jgi:spore maturation protein SpmA